MTSDDVTLLVKNRRLLWMRLRHLLLVTRRGWAKVLAAVAFAYLLLMSAGITDHYYELSFNSFEWPLSIDFTENKQHLQRIVDSARTAGLWNDYDNSISTTPINTLEPSSLVPKLEEYRIEDARIVYVMIKSFVKNFESRQAIRHTWGNIKTWENTTMIPMFIIGNSTEDNKDEQWTLIKQEAKTYNDILASSATDTYRNNTYKFMSAIQFAYESSVYPANFVVLIDDDYYLYGYNLAKYLTSRQPNESMYEGWLFETSPFRYIRHKHRVSLDEYPFDRYPPYISAGAVLLSRATLEKFYYAIPFVKYFPFDDVYAGIVAKKVQVQPTHNEAFEFWERRRTTASSWREGIIAAHGFSAERLREFHEYLTVENKLPK